MYPSPFPDPVITTAFALNHHPWFEPISLSFFCHWSWCIPFLCFVMEAVYVFHQRKHVTALCFFIYTLVVAVMFFFPLFYALLLMGSNRISIVRCFCINTKSLSPLLCFTIAMFPTLDTLCVLRDATVVSDTVRVLLFETLYAF